MKDKKISNLSDLKLLEMYEKYHTKYSLHTDIAYFFSVLMFYLFYLLNKRFFWITLIIYISALSVHSLNSLQMRDNLKKELKARGLWT